MWQVIMPHYFLLLMEQKSKDESKTIIFNLKKGKKVQMNETLLTCTEVQAILRIGKSKLYRLIREEKLPVIRLGNTYRIRKSELENYLTKISKTE